MFLISTWSLSRVFKAKWKGNCWLFLFLPQRAFGCFLPCSARMIPCVQINVCSLGISAELWAQTEWGGKREMVLKLLGKNVNILFVFTHQVLERLLMFLKGRFPISFTISRIKPVLWIEWEDCLSLHKSGTPTCTCPCITSRGFSSSEQDSLPYLRKFSSASCNSKSIAEDTVSAEAGFFDMDATESVWFR